MPTFRKKSSSSDGSSSSSSSSSPSSGSSGSDSNSSSSDSDSSSSAEEKADKSSKTAETKETTTKEEEAISQVLTRRKSAEFKAAAAAAAASSISNSISTVSAATVVANSSGHTEKPSATTETPPLNLKSSDTAEKPTQPFEQVPVVPEVANKPLSLSSLGNLRTSRSSLTTSEDENAMSRNPRTPSNTNSTKRKNTATSNGSGNHKTPTPPIEIAKADAQEGKSEIDCKLTTSNEGNAKTECTTGTSRKSARKSSENPSETVPETEVKTKSEVFVGSEPECKPDIDDTIMASTSKDATVKTEPVVEFSKAVEIVKSNQGKDTKAKKTEKENPKKNITANTSSTSIASTADKEDSGTLASAKKGEKKGGKSNTTKAKSKRIRPPPKRNQSNNRTNKTSESESISAISEHISSTPSESEASESSNSYGSRRKKARRSKRGTASTTTTNNKVAPTDSDEVPVDRKQAAPRVFTRTINTRRCKRQLKQCNGVSDSDSDLLAELEAEKRALSKSPTKKPAATEIVQPKPREPSPPETGEKKCSVDGCDSTGHLGGILDTHFLREACPLFHNMTTEECKTRARERRYFEEEIREEKTPSPVFTSDSMSSKSLTSKQMEFLDKIKESRANFKVIETSVNGEKVNGENITDSIESEEEEKREPSLVGLVPDYDLQLFRDAQALASEQIEKEVKDLPVGKGIKYITMGKYKMKVWYQSPYPDDAALFPQMFICEFCLRNQKSEITIKRHALKCLWRHPPGDEIYRKGKLQVWQVDGRRYKVYCQQLCLLAKFFLDHKTLYYDVEPFLFYIMTLADSDGCHIVGYFSKEKNSFYNVSCILTLPPYQRKGYGRLLIDFSYLLTRVEGKIGSPEKPLSDLGLISYRSYWKDVLLDYLCNRNLSTLSIKDVSQEMAIYSYDIVSTLQALGMMKYWKGKHIVLKKQEVVDEYEERLKRRGNFPKIDKNCLRWTPFVPAQNNNVP